MYYDHKGTTRVDPKGKCDNILTFITFLYTNLSFTSVISFVLNCMCCFFEHLQKIEITEYSVLFENNFFVCLSKFY